MPNGEKIIVEKIKQAHDNGKSIVRISGNYEISNVIYIPSHTTIIMEDCRLRLADGVYSQVFTNENALNENESDCDIHIIGSGTAVIDGGEYNGLSERSQNTNGMPQIWFNNFIVLNRVNNFSIEKIRCINMRWYAMLIVACSDGTIRDIDFDGDCRRIDQHTGETIYGLVRELYPETVVKNGDGIDICSGCHDILIENITGFTEDDTVALGSLLRPEPTPCMAYYGVKNFDIYNIIVRNIRSSCYCSPVRIINQGGPKIYNVLIDGVFDASLNDTRLNHGDCGVMIGDTEPYGDRQPSTYETYNICVKNVYSRADTALKVCGGITNLVYENINAFDRCKNAVDTKNAVIK